MKPIDQTQGHRRVLLGSLFCWMIVAAGCSGQISDPSEEASAADQFEPKGPGRAREVDPEHPDAAEETPEPTGPAFALTEIAPRLMPLEARLHRVARVFEMETGDPRLDAIRARETALGGYDYSQEIVPDERWSATRMSLWTELLVPLCDAEARDRRYEGDTQTLLFRAWGRAVPMEEVQQFEAHLEGLGAEQAARVRCLGALGAAEAVTQ